MKETFRSFSPLILALKTVMLPSTIALVNYCFTSTGWPDEVERGVNAISQGVVVLILELIFVVVLKKINLNEGLERIAELKADMVGFDLLEQQYAMTDQQKSQLVARRKKKLDEIILLTSR